MFTGTKLGHALHEAMQAKGVNQGELALEFGVRQPSVSEWIKFGRIHKKHIPHLVGYFAGVVGPQHWGLPASWEAAEATPKTLDEAGLLRKYRALQSDLMRARAAAFLDGLLAAGEAAQATIGPSRKRPAARG